MKIQWGKEMKKKNLIPFDIPRVLISKLKHECIDSKDSLKLKMHTDVHHCGKEMHKFPFTLAHV